MHINNCNKNAYFSSRLPGDFNFLVYLGANLNHSEWTLSTLGTLNLSILYPASVSESGLSFAWWVWRLTA